MGSQDGLQSSIRNSNTPRRALYKRSMTTPNRTLREKPQHPVNVTGSLPRTQAESVPYVQRTTSKNVGQPLAPNRQTINQRFIDSSSTKPSTRVAGDTLQPIAVQTLYPCRPISRTAGIDPGNPVQRYVAMNPVYLDNTRQHIQPSYSPQPGLYITQIPHSRKGTKSTPNIHVYRTRGRTNSPGSHGRIPLTRQTLMQRDLIEEHPPIENSNEKNTSYQQSNARSSPDGMSRENTDVLQSPLAATDPSPLKIGVLPKSKSALSPSWRRPERGTQQKTPVNNENSISQPKTNLLMRNNPENITPKTYPDTSTLKKVSPFEAYRKSKSKELGITIDQLTESQADLAKEKSESSASSFEKAKSALERKFDNSKSDDNARPTRIKSPNSRSNNIQDNIAHESINLNSKNPCESNATNVCINIYNNDNRVSRTSEEQPTLTLNMAELICQDDENHHTSNLKSMPTQRKIPENYVASLSNVGEEIETQKMRKKASYAKGEESQLTKSSHLIRNKSDLSQKSLAVGGEDTKPPKKTTTKRLTSALNNFLFRGDSSSKNGSSNNIEDNPKKHRKSKRMSKSQNTVNLYPTSSIESNRWCGNVGNSNVNPHIQSLCPEDHPRTRQQLPAFSVTSYETFVEDEPSPVEGPHYENVRAYDRQRDADSNPPFNGSPAAFDGYGNYQSDQWNNSLSPSTSFTNTNDEDDESVMDRITRKSYYRRFNDIKKKQKPHRAENKESVDQQLAAAKARLMCNEREPVRLIQQRISPSPLSPEPYTDGLVPKRGRKFTGPRIQSMPPNEAMSYYVMGDERHLPNGYPVGSLNYGSNQASCIRQDRYPCEPRSSYMPQGYYDLESRNTSPITRVSSNCMHSDSGYAVPAQHNDRYYTSPSQQSDRGYLSPLPHTERGYASPTQHGLPYYPNQVEFLPSSGMCPNSQYYNGFHNSSVSPHGFDSSHMTSPEQMKSNGPYFDCGNTQYAESPSIPLMTQDNAHQNDLNTARTELRKHLNPLTKLTGSVQSPRRPYQRSVTASELGRDSSRTRDTNQEQGRRQNVHRNTSPHDAGKLQWILQPTQNQFNPR